MNIGQYLKSIDYDVKVTVLGKTKNFKYYIQKDMPKDQDEGIPLIVEENKKKHTFKVCGSDQSLALMSLYTKE